MGQAASVLAQAQGTEMVLAASLVGLVAVWWLLSTLRWEG